MPEDLGEVAGGTLAQGRGSMGVHVGGPLSVSVGCPCGSSTCSPEGQ